MEYYIVCILYSTVFYYGPLIKAAAGANGGACVEQLREEEDMVSVSSPLGLQEVDFVTYLGAGWVLG